MPIKLLIVVTTYQSVVTILETKLNLLLQNPDFHVSVASSANDLNDDRALNCPFFPIHIPRNIKIFQDLKAIIKLKKLILKEKIDIVHTHTAKAGAIGAFAGYLAGVHVFHTYHGLPFFDRQSSLHNFLIQRIEVFLSRFRKVIFSQNMSDIRKLQKIKSIRCPIIHEGNGIDVQNILKNSMLHHNKLGEFFNGSRIHLLCVSRLESIKVIDKVISAVKFLIDQEIEVECIIAGKGHLEKHLNRQIRKLNLCSVISILYTPYIHALIAKADILALTSIKEGIPRSLLEGMALKKPVIDTDVVGTNEVVIHNETGVLVPFNDQNVFNKSLLELCNDRVFREKLGNAGYARVLDNFSDEKKIVRLWSDYYKNVPTKNPLPALPAQKRVLIVSTVGYTIEAFLLPYVDVLKNRGYHISALSNWNHQWNKLQPYVTQVHVPFSRNFISCLNIISLFSALRFLNKNSFDFIYTHTPIASAIIRFANAITGRKSRIIYEIHGLHIHTKGGKLSNFLFKRIECYLSRFTDKIITINKDDYAFAKLNFPKAKNYYSPGIGIDCGYYSPVSSDRQLTGGKHDIDKRALRLVTISDFIKRKRIDLCIECAKLLKKDGYDFKWHIIGDGPLFNEISGMIKANELESMVLLPGHLIDVRPNLAASDIFVLLSMQEGLPRSLLEAGAMGIPAVVSDIRGNRDLIESNKNSFLSPAGNYRAATECIKRLLDDTQLRTAFGLRLRSKIQAVFSLEKTIPIHEKIFFD